MSFEYIVQQVSMLGSLGVVDIRITAHHAEGTSPYSFGTRPHFNLMQSLIIDAAGIISSIVLLAIIAPALFGNGLHASSLMSNDSLIAGGSDQERIIAKALEAGTAADRSAEGQDGT
jgi:hypothetical protein